MISLVGLPIRASSRNARLAFGGSLPVPVSIAAILWDPNWLGTSWLGSVSPKQHNLASTSLASALLTATTTVGKICVWRRQGRFLACLCRSVPPVVVTASLEAVTWIAYWVCNFACEPQQVPSQLYYCKKLPDKLESLIESSEVVSLIMAQNVRWVKVLNRLENCRLNLLSLGFKITQ